MCVGVGVWSILCFVKVVDKASKENIKEILEICVGGVDCFLVVGKGIKLPLVVCL